MQESLVSGMLVLVLVGEGAGGREEEVGVSLLRSERSHKVVTLVSSLSIEIYWEEVGPFSTHPIVHVKQSGGGGGEERKKKTK